jgi:hypothetical protein
MHLITRISIIIIIILVFIYIYIEFKEFDWNYKGDISLINNNFIHNNHYGLYKSRQPLKSLPTLTKSLA